MCVKVIGVCGGAKERNAGIYTKPSYPSDWIKLFPFLSLISYFVMICFLESGRRHKCQNLLPLSTLRLNAVRKRLQDKGGFLLRKRQRRHTW